MVTETTGDRSHRGSPRTTTASVVARRGEDHFANVRSVGNAVERCRLRHAARLVGNGGGGGHKDLLLITAEDLRARSVFDADAGTSVEDRPGALDGEPAVGEHPGVARAGAGPGPSQ
jgi:hypothetical protein